MQTGAPSRQTSPSPLRAVREAHGLGLREVARRANIDPTYLSRIERGERTPSLDALVRLARVLGLRELERLTAPYTRGDGSTDSVV